MATHVWKVSIFYLSEGDEDAFFGWLQSIPGVVSVSGQGTELSIRLRSSRMSKVALREFIALYDRYKGNMTELAPFVTPANASWLTSATPGYKGLLAGKAISNPSIWNLPRKQEKRRG
jgi:hypothetical protein